MNWTQFILLLSSFCSAVHGEQLQRSPRFKRGTIVIENDLNEFVRVLVQENYSIRILIFSFLASSQITFTALTVSAKHLAQRNVLGAKFFGQNFSTLKCS